MKKKSLVAITTNILTKNNHQMDYKQSYMTHKRNAKKRNIDFFLSYDEWLNIWIQSGKLHLRGPKKGQYCMARIGDIGPYSIGNVYIELSDINCKLPHDGHLKSEQQKYKMSLAQKGISKSPAAVAKNAISQLARPKYNCPQCAQLISGLGNLKQHINNKHLEISCKQKI